VWHGAVVLDAGQLSTTESMGVARFVRRDFLRSVTVASRHRRYVVIERNDRVHQSPQLVTPGDFDFEE
jgi:hypothetical protein